VDKNQKERQVEELTERLRSSETIFVADYRGLTMPQIDALRSRLLEHGVRFSVVKNTLTRRAAEAAGADALLALLEGPTAIAFLETGGDPVAVAKALQDAARETQVLAVRGGLLQGATISSDDVAQLAKLPPLDVLRGQVLGAVTAPLMTIVGLFTAPVRDLIGLIDARIEQLEQGGADAPGADVEQTDDEPTQAEDAASDEATQADATASAAETPEQPEEPTEEPTTEAEEETT
jgi:large subunit ribosomal protein L10